MNSPSVASASSGAPPSSHARPPDAARAGAITECAQPRVLQRIERARCQQQQTLGAEREPEVLGIQLRHMHVERQREHRERHGECAIGQQPRGGQALHSVAAAVAEQARAQLGRTGVGAQPDAEEGVDECRIANAGDITLRRIKARLDARHRKAYQAIAFAHVGKYFTHVARPLRQLRFVAPALLTDLGDAGLDQRTGFDVECVFDVERQGCVGVKTLRGGPQARGVNLETEVTHVGAAVQDQFRRMGAQRRRQFAGSRRQAQTQAEGQQRPQSPATRRFSAHD